MDRKIANFLGVKLDDLAEALRSEGVREKVLQHFKGKRVFTLYRNLSKVFKEFTVEDITASGANRMIVYSNITAEVHFGSPQTCSTPPRLAVPDGSCQGILPPVPS